MVDADANPEELLCSAQRGNAQALGLLLELYRSYLTFYSRLQIGRRLRGKTAPSDVVQETFLEAQRLFGAFRGSSEQELLAWLRQILVSRLAKAVRRYYGTQRRNVGLEQQLEAELEHSAALAKALVDARDTPAEAAVRHERVVLLTRAMDQLPEEYREVILLRHFEGLHFPEVAERMNCSVGHAKRMWVRALVALRKALGGACRDD
jgi:RNA polymerase sigma-70 factor (ECF subfamily)